MRNIFFTAAFVAGFALVTTGPAAAVCSLMGTYEAAPAPKALAQEPGDGKCGYASGRKAATIAQARTMAIGFCQSSGGKGCRVIMQQAK